MVYYDDNIDNIPTTVLSNTAIYVDLDGTLIRSDILIESLFSLIKTDRSKITQLLGWCINGKAYLKHKIALHSEVCVELLPYNVELIEYLQKESKNGRKIYLATGANEKYAQKVADHLGLFTSVIASNKNRNLTGKEKLKAIIDIQGNADFAYAGNAIIDLEIWKHAKSAILVNPSRYLKKKTEAILYIERIFETKRNYLSYFKAIRIHQWLKNIMLFVPLFPVHKNIQYWQIMDSIIGFIAFCFCASGIYIFNDLNDLETDRSHPRKFKRPFASGEITIIYGIGIMIFLLTASLVIGLHISLIFFIVLLTYITLSSLYTLYLKKIVLVDVMILAILYTLRIIAGAATIRIFPRFWILAFSMSIFLSLALVKRCSELNTFSKMNKLFLAGRDYHVSDLNYLHTMGVASGYLSVIIMALYINSPEITERYNRPEVLWLLCPVILYWISRVWLKSGRGLMHDDPLVFAVKDKVSLLMWLSTIIIIIIAM